MDRDWPTCFAPAQRRWSSGPALLAKVGFGKHRGKRWSEVPADYLQWLVKSDMDDRNVRATAKHYLKAAEGKLA